MSVQRSRRSHGLSKALVFLGWLWAGGVAAGFAPPLELALKKAFPGGDVVMVQDLTRPSNPDKVYRAHVVGDQDILIRHIGRSPYGTDRTFERSKLASTLGIGPTVLFTDPASGLLITQWIDAVPFTLTPEHIIQVLRHLRRLHEVSLSETAFPEVYSLGERVLNRLAETAKAQPVWAAHNGDRFANLARQLNEALDARATHTLVHEDVNLSNILKGKDGRIVLVDWADSVVSDPYDDLGSLCFYGGVETEAAQTGLLRTYLGREPTPQEAARLYLKSLQAALHAGLWLLRTTAQYGASQGPVTLKLDQLTQLTQPQDRAQQGYEILRRISLESTSERYRRAL